MDRQNLIYFVNSQGEKTILSSPFSKNYWEMSGRYGFSSPKIEILTTKFASGKTIYDGKYVLPRTCGMKMICKGANSAERDKIFYNMLDVLIDAYGTGEGRLYIKKTDGTMIYLNCVFSSGMDPIKEYEKFKLFTVEFYAVDPWFYWTKRYVFPVDSNNPSNPHTGPMTVVNPYNADASALIHLFDPINRKHIGQPQTHGTISNLTTGETIEFYGYSDIYKVNRDDNKIYDFVDLYTDPIDKYIKGTVSYISKPDIYENENVQETIVGGLSAVDFHLQSGNNTIDYNFEAILPSECYIEVVKKYSGA